MFALMKNTIQDTMRHPKNKPHDDDMEELECPACGEYAIGIQISDEICTSCKSNLGSMIDHKPEWRNDAMGDDMSRCNLAKNPMLPESSYSTTISFSKLNKALYELQRSLVWTSIPYHERSMKMKMDEIGITCRAKDIPLAIIEYTQTLYFNIITALETNGLKRKRGKNDMGLRGASLFMAFHEDGKPRTYKEIAGVFEIEPKYVSDGLKLFSELLKASAPKVTLYNDYIEEFCLNLNLTEEITLRIRFIADKAETLGILENHAPTSVVAGCIYYVSIEYALPLALSEIEDICGVSGPTISKICDKLFKRTIDLDQP
jgi:transcription initiation factor TFIIB